MQYPIIDNLIYAYLRNGWTGLDLKYGKNLFNPDDSINYDFTRNGNIYSNKKIDTIDYFRPQVQFEYGGTILVGYASADMHEPGKCIIYTHINQTFDHIRIKHNGSSMDLRLRYPLTEQGYYTVSFDVLSTNPSVLNGLQFENIQIEKGRTATPYEPYAPPTTDIKNRLKLPMIHYFPHPVIDAIISAADGQHTEEEKEILRHYLTPLGIGGI